MAPVQLKSSNAAIDRSSRLWTSSSISFPAKHRLYKSLVVSIPLTRTEQVGT
ncbi:hypothetical protein DPMN_008647 [Dreissena polymorpha]|uniref:Uncharacterized protein n=1 Tax=Dreissena polymorpha TaxID=45954 RepID=A0A9D4MY62_DREPO|nr:hypothetical protein DPMN_008647 [Dreissena polymorpha]